MYTTSVCLGRSSCAILPGWRCPAWTWKRRRRASRVPTLGRGTLALTQEGCTPRTRIRCSWCRILSSVPSRSRMWRRSHSEHNPATASSMGLVADLNVEEDWWVVGSDLEGSPCREIARLRKWSQWSLQSHSSCSSGAPCRHWACPGSRRNRSCRTLRSRLWCVAPPLAGSLRLLVAPAPNSTTNPKQTKLKTHHIFHSLQNKNNGSPKRLKLFQTLCAQLRNGSSPNQAETIETPDMRAISNTSYQIFMRTFKTSIAKPRLL